jgi:hypothetical protein
MIAQCPPEQARAQSPARGVPSDVDGGHVAVGADAAESVDGAVDVGNQCIDIMDEPGEGLGRGKACPGANLLWAV